MGKEAFQEQPRTGISACRNHAGFTSVVLILLAPHLFDSRSGQSAEMSLSHSAPLFRGSSPPSEPISHWMGSPLVQAPSAHWDWKRAPESKLWPFLIWGGGKDLRLHLLLACQLHYFSAEKQIPLYLVGQCLVSMFGVHPQDFSMEHSQAHFF